MVIRPGDLFWLVRDLNIRTEPHVDRLVQYGPLIPGDALALVIAILDNDIEDVMLLVAGQVRFESSFDMSVVSLWKRVLR